MIVVIWTVAASIGAAIAAWATYDAWRDLQALGDVENGRRVLARGWVRREAIRFGIQAVWAAIGFLAYTSGQGSGAVNLVALLLLGTNVAVAVNTTLDVRERFVLRRIIGNG